MPDLDQQFLAIATDLTGDRSFRWHVRWTHASCSLRSIPALLLFGVVLAVGFFVAGAVLTHATEGLRSLGHI